MLTVILLVGSALGLVYLSLLKKLYGLGGFSYEYFLLAMAANLLSALTVIALLYFERLRRRGDTLFQELSEELNWFSRPRDLNESVVPYNVPPIDIRVALRTYTRMTDLPLVPGKFGPATYALVCLVAAFLVTFQASVR
jgi:hypothetical protein